MKRNRLIKPLAAVVLALSACLAQAQVLDMVPSDALVVFKVNNLQAVSTKIAKFANTIGVDGLQPMLADPLASFKESTGLKDGLDPAGELAIVMVDPAKAGGHEDQAILVLIPVAKYDAVLANFPDAKTDGGISTVKFPNESRDTFMADWGKYAAISQTRELVAAKPDGIKVAGLCGKEMEKKDIVAYANFAKLKTMLTPELEKARTEAIANIDRKSEGNDAATTEAKFAPLGKAVINQLFNVASSFLRDSNGATFGVSLTDDGISTTLLGDFAPDSYIGKQVAALKNTDRTLLTGLPPERYIFTGGWAQNPKVIGQLIDDIIDPAVKELDALGEDGKPIAAVVQSLRKLIGASEGWSVGMVSPTGQIGQSALIQAVGIQYGDPKAIKEATSSYVSAVDALMLGVAKGQPPITSTQVTENAKTVDGVKFDEYKTTFNINPQTPEEMQAMQLINVLYGPNGMTAYTAPVGDNMTLGVTGEDALLTSAVTSAKGKDETLAKREPYALVAKNLPLNRVGVFYLDLGELATTALGYAQQFGLPINIQLAPDLPPIGMTFSTDGSAARADSFVSTTLIQSLVAAGMQAAAQMHGGGGGGGMGPN